jgi:hypothetical protein
LFSLDVKRAVLVGLLVGVAYLLVLGIVMACSIPPGTDEFRVDELQSPSFELRAWAGREVVPVMLVIFAPLGWLLHSRDGNVGIWFSLVAIPYVLLLGIIVSFLCHRIGAILRARQS